MNRYNNSITGLDDAFQHITDFYKYSTQHTAANWNKNTGGTAHNSEKNR